MRCLKKKGENVMLVEELERISNGQEQRAEEQKLMTYRFFNIFILTG